MPEKRVSLKSLFDAATCWDAYDHHHSLWLRFGIDHDNLERNLRYYNMCARDFRLLDATDMKKFEQGNFHFEFLVENWLPRGSVTLFAATGGVGKSTIAHRLAMITSTDWEELGLDPPLWMGSQVTKEFRQGLVIYLSGEDGSAVFGARMKGFNFPEDPKRLMFLRQDFGIDDTGTPRTFAQFMHYLHKLPDVSLLIIDPANKYLSGIEDDAEAVSAFFDALDNFAIEKNCAVLVLHHLIKGAQPEHVREIAEILRGSEAFTDRPRVIIGMMLEGQYVVAGLAKNSLPPDLHMVQGERIFARDPVNLDLTLLPGERGIRSFTVSQTELEAIRAEKENHETEN
ncbi:MAG: AAA family ATPase [Rickettsiales bacterium]|nr:AAA family ATPase [Rickettsiales bacterium]